MKKIGILCSLLFLVLLTSCTDPLETDRWPDSAGNTLEVPLHIGFAASDNRYTLSDGTSTRTETRSPGLFPDNLYNLEIRQYNRAGICIGGTEFTNAQAIGAPLSVPLAADDDCQLLIVARGSTGAVSQLGGSRTLAAVQKEIKANSDALAVADPSADMNAMPYFLYLPHVKVIKDETTGNGTIRSAENGTDDVRLLLKRLAVRVTLNWALSDAMQSAGYELKEVKLCQVPSSYYLLPAREETEWGTTYPSTVSEFVDVYRLTDAELTAAAGSKTVWIPANVRGVSSASSAPIHRTTENAPTAASYAELVVDNSVKKERLYYRAYLGSEDPTDFNLCENTNYNWTIRISSANYTTDPRIQLLDQTPVESDNLVPTSNCLMLPPGGNLCFNPYQHSSGTNGWNDYLINTPSGAPVAKTPITSVKVLWQTKDAGTSGNLVLGYVVDDDHHENLVHITNASDINQARVHVKAPVTEGGNAVIAAYAADGTTILWSWHIWVTDYMPARISSYDDYRAAQQRTKKGTVHKYRSALWQKGNIYGNMVMMDRDLGARTGGYAGITVSENYTLRDAVNAQGLLYQWGRKDPFFGSADGSTNEINVIFDGYGIAKGVTNLARDNATLVDNNYLQYAVQYPLTFLYYWSGADKSDWWDPIQGNEATETGGAYRWNAGGAAAPGKKTIYDPCPVGWKVPMRGNVSTVNNNYFSGSIFDGFQDVTGGTPTYKSGGVILNRSESYFTYSMYNYQGRLYWKDEYAASVGSWDGKVNPQGGRLFFLEDGITPDEPEKWTIHNTFWLPIATERHVASGKLMYPSYGHLWLADGDIGGSYLCIKPRVMEFIYHGRSYGWPVRCIQE